MDFINKTGFPALSFEGVDQLDQGFHVVVLRMTYTWDEAGILHPAEMQTPLCVQDELWGKAQTSSVRYESDLCHFKPKCDVILHATAHAPQSRAVRQLPVRFRILSVAQEQANHQPVPAAPQGLNPMQSPSREAMQAWQQQVAAALKSSVIPPQVLLDKTLLVSGTRELVQRFWLWRWLLLLVTILTFGLLRFKRWLLTPAQPFYQLDIRAEQAFGGENRINVTDPIAKELPKSAWLSAAEREQRQFEAPKQRPLALSTFMLNPAGKGFITQWFFKATKPQRITLPQIEVPEHRITGDLIQKQFKHVLDPAKLTQYVAGFGIRPKYHPDRVKLAGSINQQFIESARDLPPNFDFAVWNAAMPDQQIDWLKNDETIELTNLCSLSTAGLSYEQGHAVLRISLPQDQVYLTLFGLQGSDQHAEMPANLDTLIIEPEERRIIQVWRALVNVEDAPQAIQVNVLTHMQREQLIQTYFKKRNRLAEALNAQQGQSIQDVAS